MQESNEALWKVNLALLLPYSANRRVSCSSRQKLSLDSCTPRRAGSTKNVAASCRKPMKPCGKLIVCYCCHILQLEEFLAPAQKKGLIGFLHAPARRVNKECCCGDTPMTPGGKLIACYCLYSAHTVLSCSQTRKGITGLLRAPARRAPPQDSFLTRRAGVCCCKRLLYALQKTSLRPQLFIGLLHAPARWGAPPQQHSLLTRRAGACKNPMKPLRTAARNVSSLCAE